MVRGALIDLFVDGAGLFERGQRSGAVSVYATCSNLPWWFRETEAAWAKLSSFPDEAVRVMGVPRLLGHALTKAWCREVTFCLFVCLFCLLVCSFVYLGSSPKQ